MALHCCLVVQYRSLPHQCSSSFCHSILQYNFITYSNLGKYYCPTGDFKRPDLDYAVTELTELSLTKSSFKTNWWINERRQERRGERKKEKGS